MDIPLDCCAEYFDWSLQKHLPGDSFPSGDTYIGSTMRNLCFCSKYNFTEEVTVLHRRTHFYTEVAFLENVCFS
jgi:hypothetical protein